jgi:hypothetical protein
MQAVKRDQACIWFSHLPDCLAQQFEALEPDSPVRLLIDGSETVWRRMRPGGGRATRGIRVESGKDVWNTINIGSRFTIALVSSHEVLESPEPLTYPVAKPNPREASALTINAPAVFGAYLFIDYSGAETAEQQRRAIRIAYAEGSEPPRIVEERHDRATLVDFIIGRLQSAARRGLRVCFGQDHAFGIPIGFARELGIAHLRWRESLEAFLDGTYDPDAPRFVDIRQFACEMNHWLVAQGHDSYFWSATKAEMYQLPARDPRRGGAKGCSYRLTDRCRSRSGRGNAKALNRLGDPGTVGGQSLLGMIRIRELLQRCRLLGIRLRCWPFDGLDILDSEYDGAHVVVEPYPSAFRPEGIKQTDENDALYTALAVQEADLKGRAATLFDLRGLQSGEADRVQFEGWIVGHVPGNQQ